MFKLFLVRFNVIYSHISAVPIQHRVAVLDKVTDFLLFLGKLLIVGIVGRRAFIFRPNIVFSTLERDLSNSLFFLYRHLLFLLLLWKNQSDRGCCSISELLLGANTGERHMYLYDLMLYACLWVFDATAEFLMYVIFFT